MIYYNVNGVLFTRYISICLAYSGIGNAYSFIPNKMSGMNKAYFGKSFKAYGASYGMPGGITSVSENIVIDDVKYSFAHMLLDIQVSKCNTM